MAQTLDVAFIGFIREELKFDSVDALVAQMDDDSARARAMLAAAPGAFPKLGMVDRHPEVQPCLSSSREPASTRMTPACPGPLCDFPARLLWKAHVCAAHHYQH